MSWHFDSSPTKTEEELLKYLERHHPQVPWETTERVMVGVTAAPGTDVLIRRASRMAARLKTNLHVVHVVNGKVGRRSRDGKLDELRRLVSEVGASWHELSGDDVVETLAVFARHHQITQIVVGASQRSRWQELKGGGSIVKRFTQLAASGEVDVHLIGRREAPTV